jgi:hypothetical protein
MYDLCHRGPTRCELCGDWTQQPAVHTEKQHTKDGVVVAPRLAYPMTHARDFRDGQIDCECGKPTRHHVHGYDIDCSCDDCTPVGE